MTVFDSGENARAAGELDQRERGLTRPTNVTLDGVEVREVVASA